MREDRKKRAKVFMWVFAAVMFVAGVCICSLHYADMHEQRSRSDAVEARVVEVECTRRRETDRDGDTHYKTYYQAIFEYSYAGQTYWVRDDVRTASAFGAQYSVGDTVTLWVDRLDPGSAITPNSFYFWFELGGFFVLFGIVFVLLGVFGTRIGEEKDALLPRLLGMALPILLFLASVTAFVALHFGNGGKVNLFTSFPFLIVFVFDLLAAGFLTVDLLLALARRREKRRAALRESPPANKSGGSDVK